LAEREVREGKVDDAWQKNKRETAERDGTDGVDFAWRQSPAGCRVYEYLVLVTAQD
jgi:hypothetical protein